MIKNFFAIALPVAAILGFSACKSGGGFKKTEGGLEYKIVKEGKDTTRPMVGDMVKLYFTARYKDDKMDSLLLDSRKMNNGLPLEFPLPQSNGKGDITEGIMLMSAGDSAVFRVAIDSLKKSGAQLEEWMKSGGKIEYTVSLLDVVSQKGQDAKDEKLMQEYFSKNGIQPNKTATGLYYLIETEGTGETAKAGQTVTVNYTGRLVADESIFDSNVDTSLGHAEPFTVVVGRGQVIPGWDEGLQLFKKGGKGKLFIPSRLGYGFMSPGAAIPAGSSLMFDIEVLDIKNTSAEPSTMMVPSK